MTELLLARSTRGSGRARWPCPVREVRGRPGERPGGAVWWMIGSAGVAAQPRPWCSSKGDRGWCGYAGVLALLVPRGGAHVGDGGMFGGVGVGGGDAGDPPALAEVPPRPAGDLVVSGDDADRYRLVVVPDTHDGVDARRRGIWVRCGGDRVVDGHLMVDQVGDVAEGFD